MPRRILLLITDLEIGGTPTVVRELATRLHDPPNVEIHVVCLKKWAPVAEQIRAAGVSVTSLDASSSFHLPRTVKKLRRLIREQKIETVFSFLVHANAVAALAARDLEGVRFIQSIQTTQPHPRWHWWVQSMVQGRADKVMVPSPSAAEVAQLWAHVPAERIVEIPNAIDVSQLDIPREPAEKTLTRIGFLGRLDPVKRVDVLISAMRRLGDPRGSRYHLDIFGDGPLREHLESLARAELSPNVFHFHGHVAAPADALGQIDILVLPSDAEGFGLVLIEAMAAGVPVVATNVAGIRDVVKHEQTGLLVRPRSPGELAAAITRIASDAGLRIRLIDGGKQDVRARFTWESVLPRYRSLLRIDN